MIADQLSWPGSAGCTVLDQVEELLTAPLRVRPQLSVLEDQVLKRYCRPARCRMARRVGGAGPLPSRNIFGEISYATGYRRVRLESTAHRWVPSFTPSELVRCLTGVGAAATVAAVETDDAAMLAAIVRHVDRQVGTSLEVRQHPGGHQRHGSRVRAPIAQPSKPWRLQLSFSQECPQNEGGPNVSVSPDSVASSGAPCAMAAKAPMTTYSTPRLLRTARISQPTGPAGSLFRAFRRTGRRCGDDAPPREPSLASSVVRAERPRRRSWSSSGASRNRSSRPAPAKIFCSVGILGSRLPRSIRAISDFATSLALRVLAATSSPRVGPTAKRLWLSRRCGADLENAGRVTNSLSHALAGCIRRRRP
jgi:hypothetical protein